MCGPTYSDRNLLAAPTPDKQPTTRCSQATPAASVSLIFEPESISANVVTGAVDSGQAVLVGAIEPVDGLDVVEARQSVRWNEQVCGNLPGEASAS